MTSTSALLLLGDRIRSEKRMSGLTMSGVGGCRKRAGFEIHGYPPSNPVGSVQAAMGQAIHEYIDTAVRELNRPGDLSEVEVEYAGLIGHFDRYEAAEQKVVDVKTVSSRWLDSIKLHGITLGWRYQTALYAAGLMEQDIPVKTIRIDCIVRDTGQEWQSERHFSVKEVREAADWIAMISETPFDMLPRDHEPDSPVCQGCPFLERCWEGYVPDRDKRSVLLAEGVKPGRAAEELFLLRKQIKEMEERTRELRGILDGLRPDDPYAVVKAGDFYLTWTSNGKGRQLRFTSPPQEGHT